MCEHGGQQNEIKHPVIERESIGRCLGRPVWIVCAACQIGAVEPESRVACGDRSLAPFNRLAVDIYAVVSAPEVVEQSNRDIADSRTNVQNAVLGPQATCSELRSDVLARPVEARVAPRSVVVDSQVSWRKQRTDRPEQWLDKCREAEDGSSHLAQRPSGKTLPQYHGIETENPQITPALMCPGGGHQICAMQSISTSVRSGIAVTATVVRTGGSAPNRPRYVWFIPS